VETTEQHTSPREGELPRSRRPRGLKTLEVFEHDLPPRIADKLLKEQILAVDTETTGLDFREDELCLVQLATTKGDVYLIRRPSKDSRNLSNVLCGEPVKIFHHALFDLRFLKTGMNLDLHWSRVECTKVLMKVVHPELRSGLAATLREVLDVRISKAETMTDWLADTLTEEQLWYAAGDTIYLPKLLEKLQGEYRSVQKPKYHLAMQALCYKATLEVEGYTDLLDYPQEDPIVTLKNRNWWLERNR
jgi:ribonuclease D